MKLYSIVCFGFVVVFLCETEKPPVVSDYCPQTFTLKFSDATIDRMTEAEARQVDRHNSRRRTHKCPGAPAHTTPKERRK
jgi:hypothetical protein